MEHQVHTAADAAPEDVWRLFVDVERWPEIIKTVREVRRVDSGPLHVGSEAIIRQPGIPRARWQVTDLQPGRSFTWQRTSPGVTVVGDHIVEPSGPGSAITISLRLHGPLAGVVDALTGRRTQRSITTEIDGFQAAAERQRRSGK